MRRAHYFAGGEASFVSLLLALLSLILEGTFWLLLNLSYRIEGSLCYTGCTLAGGRLQKRLSAYLCMKLGRLFDVYKTAGAGHD